MTGLIRGWRALHTVAVTTLAERIEIRRAALGLSKNAVNIRCGFSDGYISRLTKEDGAREQPGPDTIELLAAALSSTFEYIGRGTGEQEGPRAPEHWGFDRKGVAMRVLLGRGLPVDAIESAVHRLELALGGSLLATEKTGSLVRSISEEIATPTAQEDLLASARRQVAKEGADTLAMARAAAAVLELKYGVDPQLAWGVMRAVQPYPASTDALLEAALRVLGPNTQEINEPTSASRSEVNRIADLSLKRQHESDAAPITAQGKNASKSIPKNRPKHGDRGGGARK